MSAELHALVGAYSLDALDPQERWAFEAHLASCPTCTDELAEFSATAARLGAAVATAPPADLRESVLAAAHRTTQERPVVPLHRSTPPRWRQRLPQLVAAAAVLALVGTVGAYLNEHQELAQQRSDDSREAAVLAADDAVQSNARLGRDTRVSVVSSDALDESLVVMRGLPALEEGRSYQMWAIDGDRVSSIGVMDGDDVAGSTSRLVGDLSGVDQVGVTIEPQGGSAQPTTEPLLQVDLA